MSCQMTLVALVVVMIMFFVALQVNSDCEEGVARCEWESWSPWSSCSRLCAGFRTRTRNMCCGVHIPDCIEKCDQPNTSVETEPCQTDCPNGGSYIDGICHCPPLKYGVCCDKNTTDSHECARHCTWNNWDPWDDCNGVTTCGCGTRSRRRSLCCANNLNVSDCFEDCNMTMDDSTGNRTCTTVASSTTAPCKSCSWNIWQPWTPCSHHCGGGQRTRSRTPWCCNGTVVEDCLSDCELFESDMREEEYCGEICYNNGSFHNGTCTCAKGYHGNCCGIELTENNCTKCSLSVWNVWSSCLQTSGVGHRTRTRSPCCRTGQDIEECMIQCSLDTDSLTEGEVCDGVCYHRVDPEYLYILTGASSAAGAIIITSLFWCICDRWKRRKSSEHVYDRPSFNVTDPGTTSEIDYVNAAYGGNTGNPEEELYDKLSEPAVTCTDT